MKAILIGYGEVGKGVFGALSKHHLIDIEDPKYGLTAEQSVYYEVLLIAIPYTEEFVNIVQELERRFIPDVTIVFSSVPIGTCRRVGAVHSPIEGHHDNMVESIRSHKRWIGGWSTVAKIFFELAGLEVRMTDKPEATEFMKLQSLAIYGINIQWANDCQKMADQLGFDYADLKQYNDDYNSLVISVHKNKNYIRYNLDSHTGKIGGHCITMGMKLLQESMDNPFIKRVLDSDKEE